MRGTKRFAASNSNVDTNDQNNKRITIGSGFDANRAQPSQQETMESPPLDMHRAELSRLHVRALNTQFASWVQTQLQNHPDEIWEDGVRDYFNHASNIMEKFSDIVSWLKANSSKGESFPALGSQATQMKLLPETKESDNKFFQFETGNAPAFPTSSFTTSWSSGPLFNNHQNPFPFGSQLSSVAVNQEASNDVDDDETKEPSSPSVKKMEEKGIVVVHEVKCKLYVKSNNPTDKDAWKDKGTGQLSIKCSEGINKGTRESKPTIVVRNDVGKVLLNALLYPGIKTNNMQKTSIVAIFHTLDDGNDSNKNVVAKTFLIRMRNEDDRNKLAAAIQDYAPTS